MSQDKMPKKRVWAHLELPLYHKLVELSHRSGYSQAKLIARAIETTVAHYEQTGELQFSAQEPAGK